MRWLLVVGSLALQSATPNLALTQTAQLPLSFSAPTRVLHDSVVAAELRFFFEWGKVWRMSEDARAKPPVLASTPAPVTPPTTTRRSAGARQIGPMGPVVTVIQPGYNLRTDSTRPRNQHLHCHPGTKIASANTPLAQFIWMVRSGSMIRSRTAGAFSVCPTWVFETVPGDERRWIDAGLLEHFRDPVRIARQSLLGLIEAAAQREPADPFFIGQRIRFLLDLQLPDSALRVAQECKANSWWCAALTGYVLTEMGQTVRAGAAFDAALAALSPAERCRWTNFGFLLDSLGRSEYAKLTCELRDAMNTRLWWLADPLFTVPGNERRVEQFARSVRIAIREMLDRDERYEWRRVAGGDAMAEMVTRYGWPSYTWWGGPQNDRSHSSYLKGFSNPFDQGPLHEPYTSFEYSRARQHHVPSWRALLDPLTARSNDWQVNAPDSGYTDGQHEARWWPAEHFDPLNPLYQLIDGQVAMFRRDSSIILATSHDLTASRLPRAIGTDLSATLLVTDRPDSHRVVAQMNERVDHRLVLYGHIEPRPFLVGIEIPTAKPARTYAARTRFSVAPPQTLTALAAGEMAISDPVVLVAPDGDDPSPIAFDSAMRAMAASLKTPVSKRIAVFWETYGFSARDTVDVAVWIERYTSQGLLRRFGNALRVTTDLNTPIAISWREPQPGSRVRVTSGRVPIIARSVVIDTSNLPRGSYWLDVAVAKPGQAPVRSRRGIVVE